jgi:hypothetical protein
MNLKTAVERASCLESEESRTPGRRVPEKKGECRRKEKSGRKAPTARSIVAWGIAPGKRAGFSLRAESPFYSGVFPLFMVRAFSPLKMGHFPWGDAALAPGYDQSAPLALNCGFQDEHFVPQSK